MERGYIFLIELNLCHEACTRLGLEGAGAGVVFFSLASGFQEPIFS